MKTKSALITGIQGQDGAYLAKSLLKDGYVVYGTTRTGVKATFSWRWEYLGIQDNPSLQLLDWDVTNVNSTIENIRNLKPDEVYNLVSHSYVSDSLSFPRETTMVSGFATVNILEAISQFSPETKFFQAGSSEMFGDSTTSPQSEDSSFSPRNLYGSAKVFSHLASLNYRTNREIFSTAAILYNHESPLRGSEFVTRKIATNVAKVKLGKQENFRIGNLSSIRDWGYAPEYVEAFRLITSHHKPDTFVLSSGRGSSVRDFVRSTFEAVDIEVDFEGEGLQEVGFEKSTGRILLSVDPNLFRDSELVPLIGDPSKAKEVLGWQSKTPVIEIARIMVDEEVRRPSFI